MLEKIVLIPLILSSFTTNAQGRDIFIVKNNSEVLLNVPFTHQYNDLSDEDKALNGWSACGPSALTMSANFLGETYQLNEVINKLPNSVYVKGDKFYNLPLGAKYLSKEAVQIGDSPKDIYETLSLGYPIILNIQNYDGFVGHAVVVTGINEFDGKNAKSLIVHDPFVGPYREFEYVDNDTLLQPEGYYNTIGFVKPFYLR
jgi:hypothetical protein